MAGKRTIGDIARLARVSKATVSRVLNHKPDVDATTRARILRIVQEEGYVPSIAASNLAGGRSRLIGVLIPSFVWPFIPDLMRGIAETLEKTSYEIVLYCINNAASDNDRRDVINHILVTQLTAGLLAILPGHTAYDILRLHQNGLPVVMIDDQEQPLEMAWVGVDNQGGAYTAVRHLIALGHRQIAHIQGPLHHLCARERYQGYMQAMEEAGLPLLPELVIEGDFDESSGAQAARLLFALPPERRPTAIFAANDVTAYGVIAVAEECGIHIPRDIALMGFDDLVSSAHIRPPLTTIKQPFVEMGRRGIALLLTMLDKPQFDPTGSLFSLQHGDLKQDDSEKPIRIQLPTELVVRVSCGAAL